MNLAVPQINLVMAWLWILIGFLSGMIMGLKFHDEKWLGGYSSYPRRMYRLGHISFFGLGAANFIFFLTAREFDQITTFGTIASWGFIAGAITMPLCCWAMARSSRFQFLFGVPVICLISAAGITVLEVIKL